MQQNLSLYKIFYAVAAAGNISHAAKELYISQPAISKAIRRLEENLDTVLFTRTSRGVALTEEGNLLFQHVQAAFSALESGERILSRNHALGISHLRIGASTTLSKYVLLPYLQKYIQVYPNVKLAISCQSTYQTIRLLDEQKIDIGLVGRPKTLKGYYYQPIASITDMFVSSPKYLEHLRSRNQTGSLYENGTFMLLDEENITRQYVNSKLKEHSIELGSVLEVSTMDLLIEFARIGLGIACVIREFVRQDLKNGSLTEVPVRFHFPAREIGFICRKDEQSLPAIRKFLTLSQPFEKM